jgi:hypothetical protein
LFSPGRAKRVLWPNLARREKAEFLHAPVFVEALDEGGSSGAAASRAWKIRRRLTCSFRGRLKRSATPYFRGCSMKAKLGLMPR